MPRLCLKSYILPCSCFWRSFVRVGTGLTGTSRAHVELVSSLREQLVMPSNVYISSAMKPSRKATLELGILC